MEHSLEGSVEGTESDPSGKADTQGPVVVTPSHTPGPSSVSGPSSRAPLGYPEDYVPQAKLSPPLSVTAPTFWRFARTVRRLLEGLYYHDGLSAAPAMAFHFFLSLLPLLVVIGWVLGHFARTRGVEAFFDPVFDTAPTAVVSIAKRELERLGASDLSAAPLAVVGFLWLASSGVHGMMDAFERALAVPVRRPYWKKRIYSLGFVVGGLAAVAVVSFAAVGWERISSPRPTVAKVAPGRGDALPYALPSAEPLPPTVPPELLPAVGMAPVEQPPGVTRFRARVDRALALVSFFVLAVSGVALFYRVAVENPKKLRRRIWPGAVLAILLWLAISWAFGFYVSSLGQYTLYYGSLAAVAVLLIWFWLTSLALLVGAELNAQLEGSRI